MQQAKIPIEVLRQIGWTFWDPINLADDNNRPPTGAIDEYDKYLLHVVEMLVQGHGESESASYLTDVETNWMGLGRSNGVAAHRTVAEIRRCLDNLGLA